MTVLSVNLNKVALIRNSRSEGLPDLVQVGSDILNWGAQGLTVHPRPDGRHARKADVYTLKELVQSWNKTHHEDREFNVEGYPSEDFLSLIAETRPHQCTLVPDPPEALTSSAGWELIKNENFLRSITSRLNDLGCRVSLFIDPTTFSDSAMNSLLKIRPGRVELYTEPYARAFRNQRHSEVVAHYKTWAANAVQSGIGVNAGHDLNQQNLGYLIAEIPALLEVSIGHALICEALYQGLETTVKNYLAILSHEHSPSTRSH